ncbi:Sentrin-specific protease 7 [Diplodia seriata]|uniref:Sentrin-specific protease 7 n=1 Tax=Diplodia seriata TaxID=420778 RepID=A0A1S8BDN4_9PEZI|nr:Sentrin-specific protease 7 [Diplodia seriata]
MTWAAKQAEERGNLRPDKVYWFNTYFYSTLTKLAKGQKAINYAGVQRWTSKIDIFSYDYVVVPINEDQHWYLAIICNLPALAKKVQNQEEAVEKERSVEMKDLPKGGLAAQVHGLLSEKQEHPSESTKESEDSGDAMEVDQPVRSDGVTASEKFGEQQNGTRDGDETMATTPQLTADESRNDVLDEIKVLPDGQEDTSKLSPGGKKGRKKSGPPVRKLDAEQPVIIMLDSLELTHPKTTKNLKAYLVEEGKAKRGMDIDIKTLLGTTAKCIPTQDNFCDCGIFVCLYFQKFINDADNFVHKIFRKEMDKIKDWPDISPPKTRREILGLLLRLEEEQSKERSEQRKKKKAEKRRLLEGVENESSMSIPKQSSPSKIVEPEHGPKTPPGTPPPEFVTTMAATETGPQTHTPPPRAVTPKVGCNPIVVIQASPTKDTATNANRAVVRRSPRKHTPPVDATGTGAQDTATPGKDDRKRKGPSVELGDDDLVVRDAEMVPSIENRHPQLHEQDHRDGGILHDRADDQMEVEDAEEDEAEREIPNSQPEIEIAAQDSHRQWQSEVSHLLGNSYEDTTETQKERSPSRRLLQQQKRKRATPMEVIEIDDSQT